MLNIPILLIAAPASGQGKTTLTAGLARFYTRAGYRVKAFKCGPDFLDPGWLALGSGQPVHSLDLWLNGEADIRQRLYDAAQHADVILIEGVMGLFDGAPSAADLARRFDIPVLTVIDASSMAGTFGAIVKGLRTYQSGLRWAGVLANRVGSLAHAQMLEQSTVVDDAWLGAIERHETMHVPERHLGLVSSQESPDAMPHIDAVADAIAKTPLGRAGASLWAQWQVNLTSPAPQQAQVPRLKGHRIAVARDEAFCFIYPANLDTLQSLGAECVFFSPLHDAQIPVCDALWLPGGYPELHASKLGNNRSMRASVQAHVQAERPVWAECGGMMVLFDELELPDGGVHPMWGVLSGRVVMQKRLAALGPQQWVMTDAQSNEDATIWRGHTFHYSRVETALPKLAHTQAVRCENAQVVQVREGEAIYQEGSVTASYFHPWFASNRDVTARMFSRKP